MVERLARRLGYDAVAANIPEEHRKLLTHIRKEKTRKVRDDKAEKVCLRLLPCPASNRKIATDIKATMGSLCIALPRPAPLLVQNSWQLSVPMSTISCISANFLAPSICS